MPEGSAAGARVLPILELKIESDLYPGASVIVPRWAWPNPAWFRADATVPSDADRPEQPGIQEIAIVMQSNISVPIGPDLGAENTAPAVPVLVAARKFIGWEFALTEGLIPAGSTITITGGPVLFPLADRVQPELWLRSQPEDPARPIAVTPHVLAVPKGRTVVFDAPSILTAGQPAVVGVDVVDGLQRPMPPETWPALDVLVNGAFRERLGTKESLDVEFSRPGIYRIEVRSGGGGTRGVSDPIVVRERPEFAILWQSPLPHRADINPNTAVPKAHHLVDARPLEGGGAAVHMFHFGVDTNAEHALVALPAPAFDVRRFGVARPRYVQPLHAEGAHLWSASRVAAAGHRFGLMQATTPSFSMKAWTAFLDSSDSKDWGGGPSTYVAVGSRPFVDVRVNGTAPTGRSEFAKTVVVTGEVAARSPVHAITVARNGEAVHTIYPSDLAASSPEQIPAEVSVFPTQSVIEMTLSSDSAPWLDQRDWPRNGREWIGFVKVTGAGIAAVHLDGRPDPRHAAVLSDNDTRVDFLTWSHGIPARLLLTLDSPNDGVAVEVALRDGLEDESLPSRYRAPATLPAGRFLFGYDEIQSGVTRVLRSGGYEDRMDFRVLQPEPSRDVTFRWQDPTRGRAGDYYWVTVLLADGSRVWTSPVWNGGFDMPMSEVGN